MQRNAFVHAGERLGSCGQSEFTLWTVSVLPVAKNFSLRGHPCKMTPFLHKMTSSLPTNGVILMVKWRHFSFLATTKRILAAFRSCFGHFGLSFWPSVTIATQAFPNRVSQHRRPRGAATARSLRFDISAENMA